MRRRKVTKEDILKVEDLVRSFSTHFVSYLFILFIYFCVFVLSCFSSSPEPSLFFFVFFVFVVANQCYL